LGDTQNEEQASIAPPILLQYWQVVLRWKWVIAGIVITSLALGLIATLLATPKYTATSRVEISREQKKVTNVEGLESEGAGRDLEFFQTQYSLLQARSLAERVARQLRLSTNKAFFEAHGVNPDDQALFANPSKQVLTASDRQKREKLAVNLLMANVAISPIRGSALVDISYLSASPTLSAQIANIWTEQFIVQSMDRRFASTADARKFLEGRLADLRARLETSERELVNYAEDKGIVALGKSKSADGKTQVERTLVSSDLEALNSALSQATADRIALARYEAPFQKNCEAVTADYSIRADGKIDVINSCRKGAVDGPLKKATGKAKVMPTGGGAKLKVSFFGPFYGDYWVLDRADDYSWSIVGEPSGRYLWILTRAAKPDAKIQAMLQTRVKTLGYDWSLVRVTQH
jgi:lipocalin/capsular polysaccharide biosynthesis protein